jgi:hypothetical protein
VLVAVCDERNLVARAGIFRIMSDRERGETNREPWLEPRLRRAHEAVLEEALPADMVELVRRWAAKTEPEREG